MDSKQHRRKLSAPMDPLTSLAAALFPALSSPGHSSALLPGAAPLLAALRRLLFLLAQAALSLFFLLLSAFSPPPPAPPPALAPALPRLDAASHTGDTGVGRALAHVLAVASRLPVASRKYELVRGLAERLLDDNLRAGGALVGAVNRAALAGAFASTLRRLDAAAGRGEWPRVDMAVRALRSGMRWWWPPPPPASAAAAAAQADEGFGSTAAEKLAAELLWLGEKMAECGAAREAAALFGGAGRLGRRALAAEPSLQAALLRLAVFLFKHANSREFEECNGAEEESKVAVAEHRMAMLKSWLPLLCRASNGTDAPVLSGRERAEMVVVLEELVQKLSREQQEQTLALWLHHFAACPDSDWPNLECGYVRWYSESRKLLAESKA